jgi:predicted enzyme related to lactoylglutathione lyase
MPGGGQMNRFKVGESVIKVIETDPKPAAQAPPGGIRGATGYRYWTITVGNLQACVDKAKAAGSTIIVSAKEVRPGITIAIIADPDGNWVELLETA